MFFITDAHAQSLGSGGTEQLMQFLPFILMFVVLYFMMIRPQMKRQKELKAMLSTLKKGDEVATIGGVVGKINRVDDNFVLLSSATAEIMVQRGAVQSILPPGSIK